HIHDSSTCERRLIDLWKTTHRPVEDDYPPVHNPLAKDVIRHFLSFGSSSSLDSAHFDPVIRVPKGKAVEVGFREGMAKGIYIERRLGFFWAGNVAFSISALETQTWSLYLISKGPCASMAMLEVKLDPFISIVHQSGRKAKKLTVKTAMKPSVITFEPRQVMLEKQTVKKRKNKEGKDCAVLLLKSIASYLHSKGFSNSLAALQSEAPSEIDGWKAHSIDLENIFQKYLETSGFPVEKNFEGGKDQGSQKDGDNQDALQPVSKKKKKKSKSSEVDIEDENGLPKHLGDEVHDSDKRKMKDDFENLVTETDNGNLLSPQHGKSKDKKKKQKLDSELLSENFQQVEAEKNQDLPEGTVCDDQSGKSYKKSKDKKNKNRSNTESSNLNTEQSKSGVLEEAAQEIQLNDMHAKPKDKKKKKHKSVSIDSEHPGDSTQPDSKEAASVPEENPVVDVKKSSKKRKRSGSEGQLNAGEETLGKESKISKTDGFTEKVQAKQLAKDDFDMENGDLDTGKKIKVETSDECLKISSKPSPNGTVGGSMDLKEMSGGSNGQMEVNGHVDGFLWKEGSEGIAITKSKNEKSNDSAEQPKTVNAFRRVKVEEVKFLDDRLQDNSYWAKDGADIGYGAKAQEVLGQVKGRDFRHEKTKKKRGSYRGGQIDLQTHSIKFNYSDDDQ
ncbi:hypothetical protein ACLOJK_021480, partial [Asimina triloba]